MGKSDALFFVFLRTDAPIRVWITACLVCALLFVCCTSDPGAKLEAEGWIRLFDGTSLTDWEVTNFGGEGRVRVSDGAIILPYGETLTGVTYTGEVPRNQYEVMVEAQRVQGNDFFCALTFPVEEQYCSLIVGGWGGSIVGLSSIDGLDASENETTLVRSFENHRWYLIRLRVANGRIEGWIDGEQVVNLDLEGIHLDIRPEVRLSRPLGIASWQTTAAVRKIYLRKLDNTSR